jgi:threonine dehydratase
MADEIVMSGMGPFDVAYVQIGGGGLAAASACWLKHYYPSIKIVGVEGVEQASMQAAIKAGEPVTLEYADVFCDGTAVKRVGDLTFPICAELIDEFVTVSNEEVCAAIQLLWEQQRVIPEPSGAMGLAGLLKAGDGLKGKKSLAFLAGANMDFGQLSWIAQHAGFGASRRRHYRFTIDEDQGTLLDLLKTYMDGINIIDFQYGKVDESTAWPVIGVEASPAELALLEERLTEHGAVFQPVVWEEDVEFRLIHYEPHLFKLPFFIKLEFPERAGALYDFLSQVQDSASICYFNYQFAGEHVGRALMGFEFESADKRDDFRQTLDQSGLTYQAINDAALQRIL